MLSQGKPRLLGTLGYSQCACRGHGGRAAGGAHQGPEALLSSILMGTLPSRYIMTTAGNTTTRTDGFTKGDPAMSVTGGADLTRNDRDVSYGPW